MAWEFAVQRVGTRNMVTWHEGMPEGDGWKPFARHEDGKVVWCREVPDPPAPEPGEPTTKEEKLRALVRTWGQRGAEAMASGNMMTIPVSAALATCAEELQAVLDAP